MRSRWIVVPLAAGLSLVGGCSGTSRQSAGPQLWCEQALGADKVISAGPATTVADLRNITVGPRYQPAKNAFPGVEGSSVAAFCWTKGGADLYDSYGVTTDGKSVKLTSVGGMPSPPSGPPVVP